MDLPSHGREYWRPDLTTVPVGAVAVKAEFGDDNWVDFQTVDGAKVVLVAGPNVDTTTYPNPTETVALPLGRSYPRVILVGPGSKEIVIRKAGVINVDTVNTATWPIVPPTPDELIDGGTP